MDEVLNWDISGYPEPLQKIFAVVKAKGAIAAPGAFKEAEAWVWEKEKSYVPQVILDEIEGMAEGVCSALDKLNIACDVDEWNTKIQHFNMLPEVIRMACTGFGAWGPSTAAKNTLIQLRALDFGGGPWVNYTVIAVHRDMPNNDNSFVSVSFPGFVGAITGVSSKGIGISEKVWMTYDTPDLLPGSYDGLADVFVLREILENSRTKLDAEKYLETIQRTWAIWIGVGEYSSMTLDLVGYTQANSTAYTDVTMPSMTGQPYIQSVCYVDKHPQPSGDSSLPTALTDFWGNMTLENNKIITLYHQTGDVHIASYDFYQKQMYVAIGRVNHEGDYMPVGGTDDSVWKAYNRPYIAFNLEDLWAGN